MFGGIEPFFAMLVVPHVTKMIKIEIIFLLFSHKLQIKKYNLRLERDVKMMHCNALVKTT